MLMSTSAFNNVGFSPLGDNAAQLAGNQVALLVLAAASLAGNTVRRRSHFFLFCSAPAVTHAHTTAAPAVADRAAGDAARRVAPVAGRALRTRAPAAVLPPALRAAGNVCSAAVQLAIRL